MDNMDFNMYQHQAGSTAQYPKDGINGLLYTTLGLASEAGEVAGKVKKILRDERGVISEEKRQQLIDEVGDVLWYCAMVAYELQINLGAIAVKNIDKLQDRQKRGMIQGSGDNR